MKTFILDTNVLLHDPQSILKFPENSIVIPLTVLEELDKMKRLPSDLGKNARETIRLLNSLKEIGDGDLHSGVKLDNGSTVRITLEPTKVLEDFPLNMSVNDNRILYTAYHLKKQGNKVVFVSKDFAARLKAEAMGILAEDYENLKYAYDSIYRGIQHLSLSKHEIDLFYKDAKLPFSQEKVYPNSYFTMSSQEKSSAIGRYNFNDHSLEPLLRQLNAWGIKPRNNEQKCAMDLLLREEISLVTLMGPAGTGKTLLTLACALRKVFDEGRYEKILVSRPIVPLGRDIGYLPGTKEEKLFHWMQPIYDNLEFLCSSSSSDSKETIQWLMQSNKIETEAMTYIRGRSLPNIYLIIDEAQNLTPHEIKTVVSRAGEGTKVVLVGDPTQIDNPYLDENSNGLTYAVGKFLNQALYGHIYLDKTERSPLAALAAELL